MKKTLIILLSVMVILLLTINLFAQGPKPPIPSASALMVLENEKNISEIPEKIKKDISGKTYLPGDDRLIMDLNPDPSKASNACNEVFIAMDPVNSDICVSSCNFWLTALTTPPGTNYGLGFAYTQDNGGTWINTPAIVPYYGTHNRAFDPIVAFAGSGADAHTAYFGGASIKNPGGDPRIVITRVDDMDSTPVINTTKTAIPPFPSVYFSFWDKPWLAVDNVDASPYKGRVYMAAYPYFTLAAENNDPTKGGMFFVYSSDKGETWSSMKRLTYDDPDSAFSSYVQLAVGPNGEVYACYENLGFIGGGIWFEKSPDGGDTWTTETLAYAITNVGNDPCLELPGKDGAPDYSDFGYFKTGTNTRPFNANEGQRALSLPAMACDNSPSSINKGNIYISWAGDPPPNNDTSDLGDIFLVRSTDGGETWSSPITVNNDATTTDQYFPAVTTTPDGRVIVMFYDSRYDPVNNDKMDVTVAISYDGGKTFPDQRRMTDKSFSPRFSSGLTCFIGDYNGIASSNDKAVGAWCDFRTADTPEIDRKQIYSDTMILAEYDSPTGSVIINDDDIFTTSTNVELKLSAVDPPPITSGLKDMRFSNDKTLWSEWEDYDPGKTWNLSSGDGIKTVYVQYRDNLNNISSDDIADTITLDTIPPQSQVTEPAGSTANTLLTVKWTASDGLGDVSGIDYVEIYWNKDSGAYSLLGTYSSGETEVSFDTSLHGGYGIYGFYSIAKDKAGNKESAPIGNDVQIDVSENSGISNWWILK